MSRHKTPLRYPGGKQRLAPFVAEVIDTNGLRGCHYAEAYAGGAGIALELLLAGLVEHVHLNDNHYAVYAFWKSVLEETEKLCRKISSASLTVEEWKNQRAIFRHPKNHSRFDIGFSLFYLNRCNRSGIPEGGIIGGLDQTGNYKMGARFMRNELIKRIEAVAEKRYQITIRNQDAEKFILEYLPCLPTNSLIYCDPPYFNKADRLYRNHYQSSDHQRIAQVIQNQACPNWIVSYDDVPAIHAWYSGRKSFVYELAYSASKVRQGQEAFFFSDALKVPTDSSLSYVSAGLEGRLVSLSYEQMGNAF
jgi:DNA adenine methylase